MIEKLVSETEWTDGLAGLPALSLPAGRAIFLAPHPDDEALAGGLLAALAEKQALVTVVAITDGDAAYDAGGDRALADLRRQEQHAALAILGIPEAKVLRLGFPDRYVHEYEDALVDRLTALLVTNGPEVTLVAPWCRDFHLDHEATVRAAELAVERSGAILLRWFWWSWHRRLVTDLVSLALKRLALEPRWLQSKLAAVAEHRSQLGEDAILPESLLAPARRPFEVFA